MMAALPAGSNALIFASATTRCRPSKRGDRVLDARVRPQCAVLARGARVTTHAGDYDAGATVPGVRGLRITRSDSGAPAGADAPCQAAAAASRRVHHRQRRRGVLRAGRCAGRRRGSRPCSARCRGRHLLEHRRVSARRCSARAAGRASGAACRRPSRHRAAGHAHHAEHAAGSRRRCRRCRARSTRRPCRSARGGARNRRTRRRLSGGALIICCSIAIAPAMSAAPAPPAAPADPRAPAAPASSTAAQRRRPHRCRAPPSPPARRPRRAQRRTDPGHGDRAEPRRGPSGHAAHRRLQRGPGAPAFASPATRHRPCPSAAPSPRRRRHPMHRVPPRPGTPPPPIAPVRLRRVATAASADRPCTDRRCADGLVDALLDEVLHRMPWTICFAIRTSGPTAGAGGDARASTAAPATEQPTGSWSSPRWTTLHHACAWRAADQRPASPPADRASPCLAQSTGPYHECLRRRSIGATFNSTGICP